MIENKNKTQKLWYLYNTFRAFNTRRQYGRVVKAIDLKSIGVPPRRFEPCCWRKFQLWELSFRTGFFCFLVPVPGFKTQTQFQPKPGSEPAIN